MDGVQQKLFIIMQTQQDPASKTVFKEEGRVGR